MDTLQRNRLAAGAYGVAHTPGAPAYPVNILQIGDGNFLRAFVDWMVDVVNGQGLFRGGVAIAQPLAQGIAERLTAQEGLYTVLLRGVEGGRNVEARRVVSCIRLAINPYAQWPALRALAADPALRFVVSNTTEAGIADREEPFDLATCPQSFPAKVAALLRLRFDALDGARAPGLVFLPCELIEANGANLRRIVRRHAERWRLGDAFLGWLDSANHFLDTLVDRIVPGYPAAEANALTTAWGYDDRLITTGEPFHLWVIQGPRELAEEFPLHQAGLNVVWTDDLQPYRTRKVRILNGAHTATVLAAFSAGLDTVGEMMQDPDVSAFLARVMDREIVPFVPLPDAERRGYAASIVERFGNPFIRHELSSIALNSVSKWKVRVLPTVRDYAARHGTVPPGLAFSLAALIWYYRGQRDAGPYEVRDDAPVLAAMNAAWKSGDPTATILGDATLWGEDLAKLSGLAEAVAAGLHAIAARGMRAALRDVTARI
jgi:tagaturonate reductase